MIYLNLICDRCGEWSETQFPPEPVLAEERIHLFGVPMGPADTWYVAPEWIGGEPHPSCFELLCAECAVDDPLAQRVSLNDVDPALTGPTHSRSTGKPIG